jgi:hypothetical protein
MIEYLLIIKLGIILISSLILCVTWLYRGGSLHWKFVPDLPRFFDLAATPLFISLAIGAAAWPLTLIQWIALGIAFGLFTAAQAPGWGRQMDLGRDTGRDDEWGWKIRDMIFGEEKPMIDPTTGKQPIDWKGRPKFHGNFYRDLTGLYMRMAWFILPAIAAYFVSPLAAIIGLVTWLGSPIVWVVEYKLFNKYGYGNNTKSRDASPIGTSWVEFWNGVMIAVTTLLVSLTILLV